MYYYPSFPLSTDYLYPPANHHLHTEIAAIRHGHLLREQAELQYLSRTHLELASQQRAAHYENEVLEKELRMANLLESNRTRLILQRQLLQEKTIKEELLYNDQLRRLEIERYLLLNKEARPYLTDRKNESCLVGFQNATDQKTHKDGDRSLTDINKETAKFKVVPNGGEILNHKPKDYEVPNVSDSRQAVKESNYESSRRRRVQSVARDISYLENDDLNLQSSNTRRRSSILKNSNKKSPKLGKSKKQVKFLNDHSSFGNDKTSQSYCLNNSALRAAQGNPRKSLEQSASKKIENRLKVSAIVYRDSQFRNIKHQIDHLFNTYDTECRLRRDIKNKINGRDEIIQKYNLVTPQTK